MNDNVTREQIDALREIATIGAGNAATALSQMLHKKVDIDVPRVNLVPISQAAKVFGGAEKLIIAVYLQLLGDASGVILLSLEKTEAVRLADTLLGQQPGKTKILTELGGSALKETASILSGAYLSATGKLLRMRLLISSPGMAQDMAGAIVENILAETSKEADYALVMDTELKIVMEKIVAYFFFIPDAASMEKMFKVLGVK